jgi:hypothetical protein
LKVDGKGTNEMRGSEKSYKDCIDGGSTTDEFILERKDGSRGCSLVVE